MVALLIIISVLAFIIYFVIENRKINKKLKEIEKEII